MQFCGYFGYCVAILVNVSWMIIQVYGEEHESRATKTPELTRQSSGSSCSQCGCGAGPLWPASHRQVAEGQLRHKFCLDFGVTVRCGHDARF